MEEATNSPRRYLPPTGGQILYSLVDALRLRERNPASLIAADVRHVQNYFHGDPLEGDDRVQDGYRKDVANHVAADLLRTGLLGAWSLRAKPELSAAELLADALHHAAGFADGLRGILASRAADLTDPVVAWRPLLHLAAVEIGLRAGGLLAACGAETLVPAVPWASPKGAGWFIRHWAGRGVSKPMRQADLLRACERFGGPESRIDRPTVSKWWNGEARLSVSSARVLATALAECHGRPVDDFHRSLEWYEGLHAIARRIVTALAARGDQKMAWDIVRSAAMLGVEVARGTMEFLQGHVADSEQRQVLAAAFLMRGTDQHAPWLPRLAEFLASRLDNPSMQAFVLAAFGDLDELLHALVSAVPDVEWQVEEMGKRCRSSEEARRAVQFTAFFAQDGILNGEVTQFATKPVGDGSCLTERDLRGAELALAAAAAGRRGERETAVQLWREAVDACPGSARYYYKLGTALACAGQPDEAIEALRSAIQFQPDWEFPRAEIGVILLNRGFADEAESEMRQQLQALGRRDPWLLELLAGALAAQQRWREACACFDESLALRPNHPETLYFAAKAFLAAGDRRRAVALAKRAADLGRWEARALYLPPDVGVSATLAAEEI